MSGRLAEVDGRLSLNGYEFSCGEPIDVMLNGAYVAGCVEYSHHGVGRYVGWYFATAIGWCPLVHGMRVRRV